LILSADTPPKRVDQFVDTRKESIIEVPGPVQSPKQRNRRLDVLQ